MTRIVVNKCYGGFRLSYEAEKFYKEITGKGHVIDVPRSDPALLKVIDTFGLEAASGLYSDLCIEELPEGTRYRIEEYDGYETIITANDLTETA